MIDNVLVIILAIAWLCMLLVGILYEPQGLRRYRDIWEILDQEQREKERRYRERRERRERRGGD